MSTGDGRPPGREPSGPWWVAAAGGVLRRPVLWPTALVEAIGFVPTSWWRRWPPLPRPSKEWLAFRMETAYGDAGARPDAADVVAWLEWCRSMRQRHRAVR